MSASDQCTDQNCATSDPEPKVCKFADGDEVNPLAEGCGNDERLCSTSNKDDAPVLFASGRVETNPITMFQVPAPDDMFFGYRVQWASHSARIGATARSNYFSTCETQPTIHGPGESTHFLGNGFLDDFSDRLYINTKNKSTNAIAWEARDGSVTFIPSGTKWTSIRGKYELLNRTIDTGFGDPSDGLGQWVIHTLDPHAPKQIWSFEEHKFKDLASNTVEYTLGRLKRHAVLPAGASTLIGRYGYTVSWASDGTLSNVVDTFGREFQFVYTQLTSGTCPGGPSMVVARALSTVRYRGHQSGSFVDIVTLQMASVYGMQLLERVIQVGTTRYTRFRYVEVPYAGEKVSQVIGPSAGPSQTPASLAPLLTGEVELEYNEYGPAYPGDIFSAGYNGWEGYVGTLSRSPGRSYAYEYGVVTDPQTQEDVQRTTQFDLNQQAGSCGSGCALGTRCRTADNNCYVADVMDADLEARLPIRRLTADGALGSTMGNSNAFERTYTSNANVDSVRDASGNRTTYGQDTLGRFRCIVRGDDDDEAFADPVNPNTSACAGPVTSQIVRVDYGANTITKTTPSLISDDVVEVESLDSTTLLPSSTSVSGKTRVIDGTVQSVTRTTSLSRDAYGRVTEVNGPLPDAVAIDKTTTTYHTAFSASTPYDTGQVFQSIRYVLINGVNTQLVTSYSSYDLYGTAKCVVNPSGDYVTSEPSTSPGTERQTWTIKLWSAGSLNCQTGGMTGHTGTLLATSTIVINGDGTTRSVTGPDGICTTFEYTDSIGYVGAPTRIRRAPSTDACSGPIVTSSGEVEIRTYHSGESGTPTKPGEPDRLASITRQTNGVVEFQLTFALADYDRDRRLIKATTPHSTSQFSFNYTDVIQTGVTAPDAPGPGTWKTESIVDAFARPSSLLRSIDPSNKITHALSYSTPFSPRPTTLTRGKNGATASVTTFVYDDFGALVETTVPEAGPPGSPAATRYEYDVGGRMVKRRTAVGTPSVRTDLFSYDWLGRQLSVDNDTEHPVNCASAPAGTPIQDEEYRYDTCTGDVPTGFACNNALGRLTIARAILQCGSSQTVVKRGRWYNYNTAGRVAGIAYATVTGSTIGTPAIMVYTWGQTTDGVAAGKLLKYQSPLNAIYGTSYTYGSSHGRVAQVKTTEGTPSLIATVDGYQAFGPATSITTTASDGTRALTYSQLRNLDGSTYVYDWRLKGPPVDIGLINQYFYYTKAGLLNDRHEYADRDSARHYEYDALLRMTCEARGQSNPPLFATAADCIGTSSPRLAGLFTYGNGESTTPSGTSPPDVRLTSFTRSQDGTYLSPPSLETSSYASGSSQVQGVSRTGSSLVIGYDAFGRRTFEYDTLESVQSRRDYSYLPNGQIGTVSGRDGFNNTYSVSVRYDEAGRPLTIAEFSSGSPRDSYELFWDDADRLIAVNITFASPRACGMRNAGPPQFPNWVPVNCTSVRWHYHYLGQQLIAATRELVKTGLGNPSFPLKRFWAVTDERGLVYRLVASNTSTWWQARWDANGSRTWVGTPQAEMWVPFALPGQILLDRNIIYSGLDTSDPEFPFLTTAETWGTRAMMNGAVLTRPAIALNQWRAYDPLLGAFLQFDPADADDARTEPGGYLYGFSNPVAAYDRDGRELDPMRLLNFDASCKERDRIALGLAASHAYMVLSKCEKGFCGGAEGKRKWLSEIFNPNILITCPRYITRDGLWIANGLALRIGGGTNEAATYYRPTFLGAREYYETEFYQKTINDFYLRGNRADLECLADSIAHEAGHRALRGVAILSDFNNIADSSLAGKFRPLNHDGDEAFVAEATRLCFNCPSAPKGLGNPIVFDKK